MKLPSPNNFHKNNNQSYFVLVDDRIPAIKKEDGEYVPIGARSENNSEYWISLIEKAYAKLHLTYDNMCSPNLKLADHFYSLTGLLLEEITIDSSAILLYERPKLFRYFGSITILGAPFEFQEI